jgi:hypothetical protein
MIRVEQLAQVAELDRLSSRALSNREIPFADVMSIQVEKFFQAINKNLLGNATLCRYGGCSFAATEPPPGASLPLKAMVDQKSQISGMDGLGRQPYNACNEKKGA